MNYFKFVNPFVHREDSVDTDFTLAIARGNLPKKEKPLGDWTKKWKINWPEYNKDYTQMKISAWCLLEV